MEKAMHQAIFLGGSLASSHAVLEAAHAAYPLTLEAIRVRFAPSHPPSLAYHLVLPVSTITVLATSQLSQNLGFTICKRSVEKELATGGPRGKSCATLLASPALFDLEASGLIADPSFPVEMHIAEIPNAGREREERG